MLLRKYVKTIFFQDVSDVYGAISWDCFLKSSISPLPASVLRKQAEALFLPKLFTTFILLEITGLLIKKILCSPYNFLDLKLKQANALDYFTVKG